MFRRSMHRCLMHRGLFASSDVVNGGEASTSRPHHSGACPFCTGAMRDLEDARESWQQFLTYPALSDLRIAVRSDEDKSSPLIGSRSLCWKVMHIQWMARIH